MRDWISTHILPNAEEWESSALKSTSYLPKSLHRAAGAAGILRVVAGPSAWGPENTISSIPGIPALPAGIPEGEFDFFHEMIVWDGLVSCGYPGVINGFTIGAAFAAPPLIKYASEEVKKRVLPLVMSGEEQIALCITEPHAGSDVQGITTTARISDDGAHFIVNGEKKWITNGTYATFFTTAVRTGGDRGGGISILLVERGPGLSTRHVFTQASVLGGTAYVTFEDLRVPASNIVGKLNGGFHALLVNFNRERMTIATQCARHSRLVYADALHYAHRRKTFGKVLIEHPVIRDKFAQMARQIESLQCWIEFVYYQMHKMPSRIVDERLGGTCALLKLQGTRTFEFCAREAAQVMGGIAYTRGGQGGRVERLYREVRGAAIPGGSEEIMADVGMRQSLKWVSSVSLFWALRLTVLSFTSIVITSIDFSCRFLERRV